MGTGARGGGVVSAASASPLCLSHVDTEGSSAGSYQSYDQLGRVNVSYQQTDSQNYGFGYGNSLASEMTSETYPSGKQVITEYDSAGRIAGVKKDATAYYAGATANDATNRIQYAPQGAVAVIKLGNGRWEHTKFNNRLQPTQIGLGTSGTDSSILKLDFGYGTTNNNGNVLAQTITIGATVMSQSYGYDALNRLLSAAENSGANWSQGYGYDRFGNRWVSNSTGYTLSSLTPRSQSAFDATNNRLTASQYDDAGNQTVDRQNRAFAYDAENRQITFNGTGGQYFYDGDGRRVKKIDGGGTTVFVYNVQGQLIAEYQNDPVPPAAGGGGTSYLTSDHLGSTRVVTKSDGTVKARYYYLPFGEELGAGIGGRTVGMGYSAADSTKQKFTQKERDNESGLDYFLARYYSSAQGRFTSPDPYLIILEKEKGKDQSECDQILFAYISQPQIWNKYVYVLNNPLKHIDPDGRRELTQEDQDRLKKLWDEYYRATASTDSQIKNQLAPAIIGAISEIVAAIKDVVEGDADPANLRAVEFAIDNLGNTSYGDSGTVSNGMTTTIGSGENKCNIFVANSYAIGGGIGFGGGLGFPVNTSFRGRRYPPAANDLANASTTITNFDVVTGKPPKPAVGDIAAFPARVGHGHSSIYAGGGAAIYASTYGVKIQTVQYVLTVPPGHAFVTYRRYKQ